MATQLLALLTDLVERGNISGCLAAVTEASNAADLEEDSDEILALLVNSDLLDSKSEDDFGAFQLLMHVSAAGSAKTNLLSLLGGFSSGNDVERVSRLLPPVAATLRRFPAGGDLRDKMAAFALSKAVSYLKYLTEEAAVLDYAAKMEADLISPLVSRKSGARQLINALTHVFRLALGPCNMHSEEEDEGDLPSLALSLADKFLATLQALNADPVKLLAESSDRPEEDDEDEEDEAAFLSLPSRTGVGVMLYAVYAESLAPDLVPSCWDPVHVYAESMECVTALCAAAGDHALLRKGLLLSAALLRRINADSVGHDVVDSERFGRFLGTLVRAVTYCDDEELRRLGFETVSGIHSRLRFEAETKFFLCVTESKCHSGLKGWVVSKMKDLALSTAAGEDAGRKAALFGPQFRRLCLRTFRLERGAGTDLLEVSDEVMAALSFLYCLGSRGVPGAAEILSELRPTFLAELEGGLGAARAHYTAQMDEVGRAEEAEDVSVTVGGQTLPPMGRAEMRDVVAAALNTLDLMEMSLARLKSLM